MRKGIQSHDADGNGHDGQSHGPQPRNQPGGKGGQKTDQSGCFNCTGKDHIARFCPNPQKETRSCNLCGTPGHLAKDCRKMRKSGKSWRSRKSWRAGIIEWGDANLAELSEEPESKEFGELPDVIDPSESMSAILRERERERVESKAPSLEQV